MKAKVDFENITRSELEELIYERIIGKDAERNRKIISRRLIDGICYEPLAEEFSLSVSQIKNIVRKCEWRIFR